MPRSQLSKLGNALFEFNVFSDSFLVGISEYKNTFSRILAKVKAVGQISQFGHFINIHEACTCYYNGTDMAYGGDFFAALHTLRSYHNITLQHDVLFQQGFENMPFCPPLLSSYIISLYARNLPNQHTIQSLHYCKDLCRLTHPYVEVPLMHSTNTLLGLLQSSIHAWSVVLSVSRDYYSWVRGPLLSFSKGKTQRT